MNSWKNNRLFMLGLAGLIVAASILPTACRARQPAATDYLYAVDAPPPYKSLKDLTYAAVVIVQVKVKSVRTTMDQDVVTTRSEVTVIRSYKGQVAADSMLTVIEPGGFVEKDGSRINYQANGASVMTQGDSMILFLNLAGNSGDSTFYQPLGLYQGRFRIENNLISQMAPAEDCLVDPPPQVVQVFAAEVVAAVIGQKVEDAIP